MRSKEEILQLKAELAADYQFILDCSEKNQRMSERIKNKPESDEFDYAALGYTLHNLYNAFESYFLRISKFFENNLSADGWHKQLLERMKLEIPELRPALFTNKFALKVEELLRFRHVFRNIYQATLVPGKVSVVNEIAAGIVIEFKPFHERYFKFLDSLLSAYKKLEE